ncbi:hypothetical protein [Aquibium oceanicum]
MSSYLKSLAAEFLPEWLKARREGKDAAPVAVVAPEPAPSRAADDAHKKPRQE